MIELIVIPVIVLTGWLIIMYLRKDVTIEKARTRGIEVAKQHLKNPVLLEDYLAATGMTQAEVDALLRQGKIPAFRWYQFTFIESDSDAGL